MALYNIAISLIKYHLNPLADLFSKSKPITSYLSQHLPKQGIIVFKLHIEGFIEMFKANVH